jgi:nitroreductase
MSMITRRDINAALVSSAVMVAASGVARAQDQISLPAPQTDGGIPLMQALKKRHSSREYSEKPLPPQVLSNLLWAAWGINRTEGNLRTAPSARNTQDIDIYVTMANGVWLYDAKLHRLVQHMPDDLRGETTTNQPFVKTAPVNFVYVSEGARTSNVAEADRALYAMADSSVIAQNVYLFCASEGLATVMRALVPGEKLAQRMKLRATQKIYLAQTVGYPK